MPIVVSQDGTKKFAGYIERISERVEPGTEILCYRLECTDYSRLLDWRMYAGSFEGASFYDIVYAIWSAKLSADGVTIGTVENPGITITEVFQDGLNTVEAWFRKLANRTGYLYRIDEDKVLHFSPFTSNPAPFSIVWGGDNWRNLEIDRPLGDYRNVQYVRTEYRVGSTFTAEFTGDGSTRDFFVTQPMFNAPTVTADAVAQTVGRFGIDLTGFDVYYDVDGWGIHKYPAQTPYGVGVDIDVSFQALFSNQTVVEDAGEIAARASVQGDSGRIEAVHEDRYIRTLEAMEERGTGLLRQFGELATLLQFETDTVVEPLSASLVPAMRIDVDLTSGPSDVDETFLVESVESEWEKAAPTDVWRHRVSCTNIEPFGSPDGPIERLAEQSRIGPDAVAVVDDAPTPPGGGGTVDLEIQIAYVE